MIHLLLEQSRTIARKSTLIFTEILMLFKVAREQWEKGEWWENFWLRVNGCEWIKKALYIVEEGGTNKGNKYFKESIIIQFFLF